MSCMHVDRFEADGWERLSALDGTHHGEYSVLMRRRGKQDDQKQLALIG